MIRRIFSKIAVLLIVFLSILNFQIATSANVSAACNTKFLNIPTWYDGLVDSNCNVKSPAESGGIGVFAGVIVTNIIEILLGLLGYLAFGFVLYGSFLFLTSSGNSDAVARARQTIFRAIIGVVISFGGGAIVQSVADTLTTSANTASVNPNAVLTNIINLALQVAVVITVLIIIISGFKMITGGDNPDAIQKARKAIVYAIIGLILAFGSLAIVNYVFRRL